MLHTACVCLYQNHYVGRSQSLPSNDDAVFRTPTFSANATWNRKHSSMSSAALPPPHLPHGIPDSPRFQSGSQAMKHPRNLFTSSSTTCNTGTLFHLPITGIFHLRKTQSGGISSYTVFFINISFPLNKCISPISNHSVRPVHGHHNSSNNSGNFVTACGQTGTIFCTMTTLPPNTTYI